MSVNKVNPETGELVTLANGTRMWIGTQSAHDLAVQQGTMPNNCMVCITDDAPGEEAWQYSTSETRTGKTWIDGKPIYRKVITGNAPAQADTEGVYNIGAPISDFVSVSGTLFTAINSVSYPIGQKLNEDEWSYVWNRSNSHPSAPNQVVLKVGTTLVNSAITIIVEYTKTTDA